MRQHIYECKYEEQKINPTLRVSTVRNTQHDEENFYFQVGKKSFPRNREKVEKQASAISSLTYVDIPEKFVYLIIGNNTKSLRLHY
jgi:hypothetical protein